MIQKYSQPDRRLLGFVCTAGNLNKFFSQFATVFDLCHLALFEEKETI
jgi:hypothetical protein